MILGCSIVIPCRHLETGVPHPFTSSDKIPDTEWLLNNRSLVLTVGSWEIQDQGPSRLGILLLYAHTAERVRDVPGVPFVRALTLLMTSQRL